MAFDADKFVDNLLSDEAYETPSDKKKADEVEMKLPEWFDEKKFNQGRRFYYDFSFMLSASMILGLVAVFSVPTILNVLVGSRRSSSVFTAYRRYFSTYLHTLTWFWYELKPGSRSWRSLQTVRSRHIHAGQAARLKGQGTVSQRDISLTLYGFIGFSVLKPDKFSIRQLEEGDWEAYNHFWRVIGYMIGLEDRYNMCQETFEETRQVCQKVHDRVYTPCLDNAPEYFEHMSRVMLEGMVIISPALETDSLMYWARHLADVPGYIYSEQDRCELQEKLRKHLNGKSPDIGVESSALIQKAGVQGLPKTPPRLLYLKDYDVVENAPVYKNLSLTAKYKIAFNVLLVGLYSTFIGRYLINLHFRWTIFSATYLPYLAIWKFGFKNAFVNMFKEDPVDDNVPKPNSEYDKPQPEPWYKIIAAIFNL